MTIRQHVAALVAMVLLCLAASLGTVAHGTWRAEQGAARVAAVQEQLDVLTGLATQVGRYSAQVAEELLAGRPRPGGLQSARLELERSFARLSQVTRNSISSAAGAAQVESLLPDLENARRMTELFHAIDRTAGRTLVMRRDGRHLDAIDLFQREVSFRLTNELQPLIAADLAGQRADVAALATAAADGRAAALFTGSALGAIGLVLTGLLAWGLLRAVRKHEQGVGAARKAMQEAAAIAEAKLASREVRSAQFLADVSHELRTPVTILRGEAEVALRGAGDAPRLREALERVQGQAEELGELLDDLISFARAEADTQDFAAALTPVGDVVEAAVQEGDLLAEPREVGIIRQMRAGGALVEVDARRLKRALLIGIDNAVKHSPPGGRITVATDLGSSGVEIRILDEGPGVSEDEKSRVFERFFRGAAETELQNRGIGIGLPIAREIVEQHQGTIALDNRPEGGAVLTIMLPRAGSETA